MILTSASHYLLSRHRRLKSAFAVRSAAAIQLVKRSSSGEMAANVAYSFATDIFVKGESEVL